MKKAIALLFVAVLTLSCFSCVAFAEDESGALVKHTITIEVPSADNAGNNGGDDTDMWDQYSTYLESGYTLYPVSFSIPDRYFAFESYGTGNSSALYSVTLIRNYYDTYAGHSNYANGTVKKTDWVTVDPGSGYQFRIVNNSGYTLYIHLTYYSWQ